MRSYVIFVGDWYYNMVELGIFNVSKFGGLSEQLPVTKGKNIGIGTKE